MSWGFLEGFTRRFAGVGTSFSRDISVSGIGVRVFRVFCFTSLFRAGCFLTKGRIFLVLALHVLSLPT